jgi:hypothetical protein
VSVSAWAPRPSHASAMLHGVWTRLGKVIARHSYLRLWVDSCLLRGCHVASTRPNCGHSAGVRGNDAYRPSHEIRRRMADGRCRKHAYT